MRRNPTTCVASPSSASRCSLVSSCSLPAGSRPVLASPHFRSGSAPTGSLLVPLTACAGRKRRRHSSRFSALEGSAPRVSSAAALSGRSERVASLCSVSVSSGSVRSAGTSRCSNSGCGATGSVCERWTGGSPGAQAWRCAATRAGAASLRTGSPGRRRIGHSPAARLRRRLRRGGTSSSPARASSRSPRATT